MSLGIYRPVTRKLNMKKTDFGVELHTHEELTSENSILLDEIFLIRTNTNV